MTGLIGLIFQLIEAVIGLIIVVLIIHIVLSWLISFQMVSRSNAFIGALWQFTSRVTEPLARPFRRLIPPVAGFDFSIAIVLFILFFLQGPVLYWLYGVLTGRGPVL